MVLVDYANVGYARFSTGSQSFLYGLFCLQVEYVLNVLMLFSVLGPRGCN